jgi:hypothetical protein
VSFENVTDRRKNGNVTDRRKNGRKEAGNEGLTDLKFVCLLVLGDFIPRIRFVPSLLQSNC